MAKTKATLPILQRKRDETRVHYERFHNIFLYITERCQLRCGHCYMGDRLDRGLRLSKHRGDEIIRQCHDLGAQYITFLGGEPTLHPELPHFVTIANELGYEQVIVDSNGLLPDRLMRISPESLYYVSISLDGATPDSHDRVRGPGTFEKTCHSIESLTKNGYSIRINSTVFSFNYHEAEEVIQLAQELGAHLVNFHTFSEEGCGRDKQRWSLSPDDWVKFYELLPTWQKPNGIAVWFPPTWATRSGVERFKKEVGFRGCLGPSLDRLSIFPDGRCYVCSLLFDTPYHFATLTEEGLSLNKGKNEFTLFSRAVGTALSDPAHSGCPAEQVIGHDSQSSKHLISMCRCWKAQA